MYWYTFPKLAIDNINNSQVHRYRHIDGVCVCVHLVYTCAYMFMREVTITVKLLYLFILTIGNMGVSYFRFYV